MKKHNLFKVVMIIIAITVLVSWVCPITYFSSEVGLIEEKGTPIGIFSLMSYIQIVVQAFCHIGIYVLIIGGLYGVLHKIPAYSILVNKIVKGFKEREPLFMCIVMVAFAVLSAMVGLSLPLLVMFPFVISVILAMGYDKITAAMVTAGAVTVGLIGSVFSSNNTYGFDMIIGSTPDGDVLYKILLLVFALGLLIFNVIIYSKKHRDTKNLVKEGYIPETTVKKAKIWPIVAIMDAVLLILVLAFFSWKLFDVTFFDEALKSVNDYEIFNFKIFKSLFGLETAFGLWGLVESSVLLLFASWLISFLYKMKFNDYITSFIEGAKRALKPAVLSVLIYLVLVITSSVPNLLTIFKPLLDLTSGINAVTMSIVAFFASVFSVESYWTAVSTLPYVVNVAYGNLTAGDITLLSLIWQSMYGVAMLVAPTSVVLIATLGYLHIPYGKWLKSIGIFLLELLAAVFIVFLMVTFI